MSIAVASRRPCSVLDDKGGRPPLDCFCRAAAVSNPRTAAAEPGHRICRGQVVRTPWPTTRASQAHQRAIDLPEAAHRGLGRAVGLGDMAEPAHFEDRALIFTAR